MEDLNIDIVAQTSISHTSALRLINLAVDEADKIGISISACVVDVHGRVKAQIVMDGASIIADELVVKKARTALLGLSSSDFASAVESTPAVSQSMLQLDQMTLLGGGFPLIVGGQVVAGFAVGGALLEQDIQCAQAVLAAVTR